MFSVDTVVEAKHLITLCCPMNHEGHYYARELAAEQTLENLQKFSDTLARGWALMKKKRK